MNDLVMAEKPCLCVVEVKATHDHQLRLAFSDGSRKIFDFRPMLQKRIYQALNNISLFVQAKSDGCGVVWNDDTDIDPVYLYENGKNEV